jgi:filamentous hemagglutinin family protein
VSFLALGGTLIFSGNSAIAQITPDSTLGTERSIVTPLNLQVDRIDGGAIRGTNLFHSFQEFNIGEGRGAYFANPAGIENIISRVTGGNSSQLLGTLGVLGNANLFFLNPNGIIFGPNARLDVNGSFVASTASSLTLSDGTKFSATNPQTPPLLTVNVPVPIGLQFEGMPGVIRLQGARLEVDSAKTLALIGGNVNLEGGALLVPGGRVELGGVAGVDQVRLNEDGSLGFPQGVQRADVSLINGVEVNVRGEGGGSIAINAENLNLQGASKLRAGIASGLGSDGSKAGDIEIDAIGAMTLTDAGSFISNAVLSNATGNGGDVRITTRSLRVTNGAQISAGTYGQGNAGSVNINVRDTASFDGVGSDEISSGAYSRVEGKGVGQGGNVNLTAGALRVTNGALLQASTLGQGNAGSVTINVRDTASFDGVGSNKINSGAYSQVEEGGVGQGGNVNLTAGSLSVINGAVLNTSTLGQQGGNAGNVNINVRDTALFDGQAADFNKVTSDLFNSGAYSRVEPKALGNAGSVNVTAETLRVINGAVLTTSTNGQGKAGNVTINAGDVVFDGEGRFNEQLGFRQSSGVFSAVKANGEGQGGNVNLTARSLSVTNGATLVTSTLGLGKAGSVTINVRDQVSFDGGGSDVLSSSGAYSRVEEEAVLGQGGNVSLTAGSLSLTNGAYISTSTLGRGNAGSVTINVRDKASFDGEGLGSNFVSSGVFSQVGPKAVGQGGDINLTAGSLSLTNGATLFTGTFGSGKAGNILVNNANVVTLSGVSSDGFSSGFYSSTEPSAMGQGGKITVNTPVLRVQDGAVINAQTQNASDGGSVTINANTFEATNGGQVLTSTRNGGGNAGNITLNILDNVTLSGSDPAYTERFARFGRDVVANVSPASGLFANTDVNSTGAGGNIFLHSNQLTIRDGAVVTVSSQGSGTAGDINATSRYVLLDKQGAIVTEAFSSQGGNIKLQVQDLLLMRDKSRISATAGLGGGGGDGGNIKIDAKDGFIVAFPSENSDIRANAFTGNGGRVDITAFGIYGLQFRKDDTRFSDITASSKYGLNGVVLIYTPEIDPSRGLANLPKEPRSVEVAQGCQAGGRQASVKYFEIGRGGSPPRPDEPLSADTFVADWIPLDLGTENRSTPTSSLNSHHYPPGYSKETQVGVNNSNGEAVSTAQAPNATRRLTPPCHAR